MPRLDVFGFQLLELVSSEVWDDLSLCELGVTLKCLGRLLVRALQPHAWHAPRRRRTRPMVSAFLTASASMSAKCQQQILIRTRLSPLQEAFQLLPRMPECGPVASPECLLGLG